MTMTVFFSDRIISRILFPLKADDSHLSGMPVARHLERATKFALAPGRVYRKHRSRDADRRSMATDRPLGPIR